MPPPGTDDDDVFARLKESIDPTYVQSRESAMRARVQADYERAQRHLGDLITENTTLPVKLASIRVEGAPNTRAGFLAGVVAPALSNGGSGKAGEGYTLGSLLEELQGRTSMLQRFDIFHPTIAIYLDRTPTPPGTPSTPSPGTPKNPTPISALLTVREKSRLSLKTGTDLSSTEGSGYIHAQHRNLLGGAEHLSATATLGTRTSSAYDLTLTVPVLSNPGVQAATSVFSSTRSNAHYAAHTEAVRGLRTGVKWGGGAHELAYSGVWRQIGPLDGAGAAVRADAGDSVKSALRYGFVRDGRDNGVLPGRGWLWRGVAEWAGLGGDVGFVKGELESQGVYSVPRTPVRVVAALKAGLMVPGFWMDGRRTSRINDRFQLGGPTEVRGFRECGLGPKDGVDSVGGDAYVAWGVTALAPVPRLGVEKPVRLQAFVNGARLVGLQEAGSVGQSVGGALRSLGALEGHSVAAGVGIVYAHPVARFELNFCLPLVDRGGDRARKGLQFGIGMNFR